MVTDHFIAWDALPCGAGVADGALVSIFTACPVRFLQVACSRKGITAVLEARVAYIRTVDWC